MVASNTGWSQFCAAVKPLPQDQFPKLRHLVYHGWARDTRKLLTELDAAAKLPLAPDVAEVLSTVHGAVDGLAPDAAVTITNGMSADAPEEEPEEAATE